MNIWDDFYDVLGDPLDSPIRMASSHLKFSFSVWICAGVEHIESLFSKHISYLFVHEISLIENQHELWCVPVVTVFHLSFQILVQKLFKLPRNIWVYYFFVGVEVRLMQEHE